MLGIIYIAVTILLLIQAFKLMSQGWNIEEPDPPKLEVKTRQITKQIHPEMADVKNGDELLVVNFSKEVPQDPLLRALDERIYNGQQIDDPWDDDEDDGDGDVPARLIKT